MRLVPKLIFLWTAMMGVLLTLPSCSDGMNDYYYQGPDPVERRMWTYIRIETEQGFNPMLLFNDIMQCWEWDTFNPDTVAWIDIKCVRASDQAEMTLSSTSWYSPQKEEDKNFFGEGPLLVLSWLDMDALYGTNSTTPHEDAYTLRISSNRIFDHGPIEIKWSVRFSHNNRLYDFWKCEIEGVETDFQHLRENDPKDGVFTHLKRSSNN